MVRSRAPGIAFASGSALPTSVSCSPVTISTGNHVIMDSDATRKFLTITNDSVTDNAAGGVGAGLRVYAGNASVAQVTVLNSIIWGNDATSGHDMAIRQSPGSVATVDASFSDVGDVAADADAPGVYNDLGNNIDANPLFVNRIGGDLRLDFGSPAIDKGTNVGAPAMDFEGTPRPQGLGIEIGADERVTSADEKGIRVKAANGGEVWPIRSMQTIQWISIRITGKIKVQLSRDGGVSWKTLFAGTANDGAQNWRVTKPATSRGRIRVCSVKNPSVCDTSDANFVIQ